jgi:hypothetical protein
LITTLGDWKMAKDDVIQMQGEAVEKLRNATF